MILTDKDDYERHLKKQYQNVNIVKVKDVRKAFPHITQVKAFLYNIGQRLIRDQEYDYVVVCDLGRSGMGLDFNKCFTNGDKWKAISGVGIKPDGTKVYNDTFNLRCVGHRFNEKELQFSLMKRGCTEKEAEEIAQDKYEVSDLEQMEVESAYHGVIIYDFHTYLQGTYIGAGTSTLGAYFPGTDASETAQRAMGCPDSEHVGFHNSIRVREPDFRIGIVSDIMSGV